LENFKFHFMRPFFFSSCLLFSSLVLAQNKAEQYFHKGYYFLEIDKQRAIESFTEAINANPDYAFAHYYRAIANYKLGNYESAIRGFGLSISLDSNLTKAYMLQGLAYKNLDSLDKAGYYFDKYLESNPSDSSGFAQSVRGRNRISLGKYKEALEDFSNAKALNPREPKYLYFQYQGQFAEGNYKEALNTIDEAMADSANFHGHHFYRGYCNFLIGNFQEAITDLSTSIELFPENSDAYYRRGLAYDTLQIYHEAVRDFTNAIRANPNDGTYYFERGNTKLSQGNKEAACLDWTIAGNMGFYKDFDRIKKVCE